VVDEMGQKFCPGPQNTFSRLRLIGLLFGPVLSIANRLAATRYTTQALNIIFGLFCYL
jgi:hypothetical protein